MDRHEDYTSRRKSRELAGEYVGKMIKSKVKDKYKKDTDTTRKLNYGADSAKKNIKAILTKVPTKYIKNIK
jgi:hypothetical protein